MRERGLKCLAICNVKEIRARRSREGAWIEILTAADFGGN